MSLTYLRPSRLPILSFLYPRQPPSLLPIITTRNAAHASEGRANGAKPGPGKRLGAKKGSTELVVPGNIIFRQRGTHWFPGENCGMGRDHTIFAREKGYVTYYRDPERHPRRKYIGVVFERGMTLPVGRDQPRRRRLGLVGREMSTNAAATAPAATPIEGGPGEVVKEIGEKTFDKEASALRDQPKSQRRKAPQKKQEAQIKLQANYSYREANWEIGRAAEYAAVKVKKYDRNDRFAVWRKRNEKKAEELEKKMLKKARKAKGKNK